MNKYSVSMSVLGRFTIETEADGQTEAYDKAVDAFFDALDKAGISYDIERRVLDDVTDDGPTPPSGGPTR